MNPQAYPGIALHRLHVENGTQDALGLVQLSQASRGHRFGSQKGQLPKVSSEASFLPKNPEFTPLEASQQKTVAAELCCGRDRKFLSEYTSLIGVTASRSDMDTLSLAVDRNPQHTPRVWGG